MRNLFAAASAILLGTTALGHAGGIDKSGQSMGVLFQDGRYLELSLGRVMPKVSGEDLLRNATGNVARDLTQISFGYKADLTDQLSYAIIVDQPFGADVFYGQGPVLGGTSAKADATAATVMLRYKLNERFAVHGGLRAQKADATIDLSGGAYGGLSGYSVTLAEDISLGYSVGASYEIPDIALRIAVIYNSKIEHEFDTVEFGALPSVTTVSTPQSINLDAQTGIAKDTLLFGQIRWAEWSTFKLSPAVFNTIQPGKSLVTLDDTVTYTLGVGRKFNDTWSGAASMTYERAIDPAVSPLAPTDGRIGATLAAVYTVDNMKITTGINYSQLGDANPTTDVPVAAMTDSSALGVGVKIGFTF